MNEDVTGLQGIFPGHDWNSPRFAGQQEDFTLYWDMIQLLHKRRMANSQTQTQVAELMKSTQSAVSELESLGSRPRIDTVQRYARAIGYKIVFELVEVEDDVNLDSSDAR